jgi:uncharacterized protein (DUF3084 family)
MASVMEVIRRERERVKEESKRAEERSPTDQDEPAEKMNWTEGQDELARLECESEGLDSQVTQTTVSAQRINGSERDLSVLTGKLCRRVMVLIWWNVGANKAVNAHVVWALEGWLRC